MSLIAKMLKQKGFTLLEVMVVLTIIALILGMATLSSGGNEQKQEAQQQALRLIAQFDAYRNEAVFQNIDLGLAMDGQSTQLLTFINIQSPQQIEGKSTEEISQLKDNPWSPYAGNLINATELPETLFFNVFLEDKPIDFAELVNDDEVKPAILFLSSDEYTPFKMNLQNQHDESFSIIIEGDGFSRFQMRTENYDL